MSDLRAITAALRAFATRLTSIEECLVVVLRNSEQESDWRHEQRNMAHADGLRQAEQLRALKQVEEFQGALWKYLAGLDERLEALSRTRFDDVRELKARVRALEEDEVTQT